ncbi:dipeptidase [Streptomyces beihaiensis]|uniref:Membrane dipeptidase n=1 Tax=Streptomyces beihaiensis TaxID=2984495 RepID=A0ABT3U263_9ACTN|nr:membrane dipeptidase [Streptomyces beihaiensis]MCX3063392.1 membrane dipeptidase [Streptomyces beihaiensis]
MADLQDTLNAPAEAGELDRPVPTGEPTDPHPDEPDPTEPDPTEPDPAQGEHTRSDAHDPAPDAEPGADTARALLAEHPVADGYSGLSTALLTLPWYDLELGESTAETDLPRLRTGAVGALFCALRTDPAGAPATDPVTAALEQIDLINHLVAHYPEGLRSARSASETTAAHAHGRAAVLIGPAPAAVMADSLGTLRALHTLGLRVLTLGRTSWATDEGLTRFGEEVVREMNRLGMLADLTGAPRAAAARAIAMSQAPVVFTHSGARALTGHPDNVPDDVLHALGESGGLCMVPCSAAHTGPRLRDVADHLDHVRRLAGPESVGISGTYDTGIAHPEGLADISGYPALIAELLDRGWPEPDITLLTWGNVQRVLRKAEFTARAAQRRRGPSTAKPDDKP